MGRALLFWGVNKPLAETTSVAEDIKFWKTYFLCYEARYLIWAATTAFKEQGQRKHWLRAASWFGVFFMYQNLSSKCLSGRGGKRLPRGGTLEENLWRGKEKEKRLFKNTVHRLNQHLAKDKGSAVCIRDPSICSSLLSNPIVMGIIRGNKSG